jgi:plastocyanin
MHYAIYSLIAVVIIGGGWFLLSPQSADAPENGTAVNEGVTDNEDVMVEGEEAESGSGMIMEDNSGVIKDNASLIDGSGRKLDGPAQDAEPDIVVDLTGKNFAFSKKEIKIKEGDIVQINFTSENGFHDWKLSEYEVATEKVNTGGSSSVTFTASKAGSFEYYCSVGSHRTLGMVGTLIVE